MVLQTPQLNLKGVTICFVCIYNPTNLFPIRFNYLPNLPNPVINRTMVNEMYSGINELTSIPVATISRAMKEVFLRPILSESVPKAYEAKNIALIYMLPVNATYIWWYQ